MAKTALVIGGTGPTGPPILNGLLGRGFEVTIFHRGTHEPPDLPDVKHIHGDPHFRETIAECVGHDSYDVVLAAYGRTRYLAESFADRAGHFLAIGGSPRYAGLYEPQRNFPGGTALPINEEAPSVLTLEANGSPSLKFAHAMVKSEQAVFASHPNATFVIYPIVYGPRTVWPWEWSVIRRIRDGRSHIVIPDEGNALHGRVASQNAAELILCAVDRPEKSKGQTYNAGDMHQYTVRQWVELVLEGLGAATEIVSVPSQIAPWIRAMYIPVAGAMWDHSLLDTSKARYELGMRDVVSVREAVAEMLEWYDRNPVDEANSPALIDSFDYQAEDRLIRSWGDVSSQLRQEFHRQVVDDVHPMAHPKVAHELTDQKGR